MLKHVLLAFVLSVARGQDNAHVRIDTGGEIHVARGGSFVIGATPEVADPSPPSASPLPPPSPSPAPPPLHTTADLYIPFIASEGGYTDAITNLAPTTTSMSNMPSTGFTYASFNTASDANDYVAYPASSAAHVGTGDFTITFRMRTDTYSTADGVPLLVVDIGLNDGAVTQQQKIAVQVCAGLFNRDETKAGAVYTSVGQCGIVISINPYRWIDICA